MSDTTPGGKTQEEVDEETDADLEHLGEVAVLQKTIKDLEERLSEALDCNIDMAKREVQLTNQIGRLYRQLDVVVPPREEYKRMTTLAVISLLALFTLTIIPGREPEPVTCPPAPTCPEVAVAPAGSPTVAAAADGYFVPTELGDVRVPWPDASGYNSEVFIADCREVCEVRAPASTEPGRVLTMDPSHLVCICLHADSPFPVTRWVNWERVH